MLSCTGNFRWIGFRSYDMIEIELEDPVHALDSGMTYFYNVYGDPGDSFTLTLTQNKDMSMSISDIEILPEAFDLIHYGDYIQPYELEADDSDSIGKIIYSDGTIRNFPAYSNYYEDGYGNLLNRSSRKIGQDADSCTYQIGIRYQSEQNEEWKYVYKSVDVPFISAKAKTQLSVAVPVDGTLN